MAIEFTDRLRWSGMLFQFAGLAMVAVGLNFSRPVFVRSSIWKAVGATVNLKGATSMTMSGKATGLTRKSNSVEDRVEQLETDLKRLQERLTETSKEVSELRSDSSERIDAVADPDVGLQGHQPPRAFDFFRDGSRHR